MNFLIGSGNGVGIPARMPLSLPFPTEDVLALKTPKPIRPFQLDAIRRFVLEDERMLVLLKASSGKTAIAIGAHIALRKLGLIDTTVVVAPRRAARKVWQTFFREYAGIDPILVEGDPKKRKKLLKDLPTEGAVLVTRYDTWRTPGFSSEIPRFLGERSLVVIDEVHHLKNPLAVRSKAIKRLLDRGPNGPTRYRLFLTGTALHDKPVDAYGPIDLLSLRIWTGLREFEDLYFTLDRIPTRSWNSVTNARVEILVPSELKGPAEAKALGDTIREVAFYRTPEELGLELPALVSETIRVEPTPEELAAYEKIVTVPIRKVLSEDPSSDREANLLALLSIERDFSSDPSLLTFSETPTARLSEERAGGRDALLALSPGSKFKELLARLANLLEEDIGTKVVVFTPFDRFLGLFRRVVDLRDVVANLDDEDQEAVETIRGHVAYFSGALSDREGDAVLTRFLTDPNIRVLLSTDSGAESQNLQGAASTLIHYDVPLSLGTYDQRLYRIRRPGSTARGILEAEFVLAPREDLEGKVLSDARFVDERIRSLLAFKRRQREAVLDG